jgi:hypothetical protein
MTNADMPINAYELSEQLGELDRSKAQDQLDTHRPSLPFDGLASDSGSKIVILGNESAGGSSLNRRLQGP